MKQTLRKILAVLVVFSIVLSVGVVALTGSAAGTMYFEDDFNTGTLADHVTSHGWSNSTSGVIEDGVFKVNAGNFANWVPSSAMKQLTDYVVEADVKVDLSTMTGTAGTLVFALSARTSSINDEGYEFGICFSRNDPDKKPYVRMYRRSAAGNAYVGGGGKQPWLEDVLGRTATLDETYHLKMVLDGSTIKGYVNGVEVYNDTDSGLSKGTFGVKGSSVGGVVDNFKVYSLDYTEDTSSDASSDTQVPYFFEDFNDDTFEDGWNSAPSAQNVKDGALMIGTRYLSNHAVVSALTDYAVEAKIKVDTTSTHEGVKTAYAGITGRLQGGKGYEFAMMYDYAENKDTAALNGTYARLIYRGSSVKFLSSSSMGKDLFEGNKEYILKMVFVGTVVKCYVDGVLIGEFIDDSAASGAAGMCVGGHTAYIDDYTVRAVTQQEMADTLTPGTSSGTSSDSISSESTSSDNTSSGAQLPEGYYFFEDFNDDTFGAGWNIMPTADKVTNGKYLIASSRLNANATLNALTDYVVEAKVTVDGTSSKNGAKTSVAGITGRDAAGNGYEFCLLYNYSTLEATEPATSYMRLYLRGDGASVLKDSALMGQLELNREYTLKMAFIGSTIKCYVDGVLVYELENTARTSGAPGMYRNGHLAYIDDYTVRAATQQEIADTLTPGNTSSNTSSGSTSSGNTSSGNTSSGSPAVLPEGYYFYEDFNDSTFESGWSSAPAANALKDGSLKIAGRYLSSHPVVKDLTDYVVEAKVTVDTTSSRNGAATSVAGITGRVQGGRGYEFGLTYSYANAQNDAPLATTYARLIYRGATVKTISDTMMKDQLVENTEYTLKMAFIGNMIKCYVNGKLVGEFTDESSTSGAAGMCFNGYDAYIDDFTVRVPTQQEKDDTLVEKLPDGYYFIEDFDDDDFKTGWNTPPVAANLKNGTLKIAGRYLSSHPVVKDLTDYVVEAKVTVDTTSSRNGARSAVAGISGRVQSGQGYEFGLCYEYETVDDGSALITTYARLYYRGTATTSKQLIPTMAKDEIEVGGTYTLKMVFIGSQIKCYIDDELVGEIADENHTYGAAGMCFNGYDAYIDDFIVRVPTEAEKAIYVPQAPVADANGVYYTTNFESREALQSVATNWVSPFGGYQNGQAMLSHDLLVSTNYLSNADFALLTDYVIDAVITIDPDDVVEIGGPVVAITGRLNSAANGFELGLIGNTDGSSHNLRIYDRQATKELASQKVDVKRGTAYRLRLVMVGDVLRAYLDDAKIFDLTGVTNLQGSAGMMINGVNAFIDSYTLRKPTAAELKGEGGTIIGGDSTGGSPGTGDSVQYMVLALSLVLAAATVMLLLKPKFAKH